MVKSEQEHHRLFVMNTYIKIFPIVALMAGVCFAASAPTTKSENADATGIASRLRFPYSQGWLGADDAYSIPFGEGKSLRLFGDTFAGDASTTPRNKSTMVRNSVGITTCASEKECTIQYYWLTPEAGKPRSFFDTGKEGNDIGRWTAISMGTLCMFL